MIPALIFTNLIAFTLLTLTLCHWESSLEVAHFITKNRSVIAIIVQLISHLLGLILVLTLCESYLITEQLESPGQIC